MISNQKKSDSHVNSAGVCGRTSGYITILLRTSRPFDSKVYTSGLPEGYCAHSLDVSTGKLSGAAKTGGLVCCITADYCYYEINECPR
jgi:hypothetical protein